MCKTVLVRIMGMTISLLRTLFADRAGNTLGNTLGTGDAFGRMNTGLFGANVVTGSRLAHRGYQALPRVE